MTDSELRVAVAEARGWKRKLVPPTKDGPENPYEEFQHTWWYKPDGKFGQPPNYPGDLNACAEFEATLSTDIMRWKYIGRLIDETKAESLEVYAEAFILATATARQRCIAFLRTVRPEGFK